MAQPFGQTSHSTSIRTSIRIRSRQKGHSTGSIVSICYDWSLSPFQRGVGLCYSSPRVLLLKLAMVDQTFQLALSVGVPTLAVLVGILINNSRLSDLRSHMDARFDDAKDTWRAELHRVEEVLNARLRHLEER